jgi:outer membrane protein assembly factor BamB
MNRNRREGLQRSCRSFLVLLILTAIIPGAVLAAGEPGTMKWSYPGPTSSPAIAPDGTIYSGGTDPTDQLHYLYAFQPDGTLKWQRRIGGYNPPGAPAVSKDGHSIFITGGDGYLYHYGWDGNLQWKNYVTGFDPVIGPNGLIYVGSSWYPSQYPLGHLMGFSFDGGVFFDFDLTTQVAPNAYIAGVPAFGPDGTIYVYATSATLGHHYFVAIRPDATLKWVYPLVLSNSPNTWLSPTIGWDGIIHWTDPDRYTYAFYPDGTEKWRHQTQTVFEISSTAIGPDGTLYEGRHAYYPDGSVKWTSPLGLTGMPAIGKDGTLFIGDFPGSAPESTLYAINPDGTQKWSFPTTAYNGFSSAAIGPDGTVYVGCSNGNLYAIYSNCGGLANGQWPMLYHDPRHTNLQPFRISPSIYLLLAE